MISKLFALRGTLDKRTLTITNFVGLGLIILLWACITMSGMVKPQLLPSPTRVLGAFAELHFKDALVRNIGYSISLNVLGYVEAVSVSLILGFCMGMFPLIRGLFSQYLNAGRFLPMTALGGLFILWAGIELNMKVQFLSFSIILYLVPVVVQRIDEIDQVFEHTAITLGASSWQRIFQVYVPSVMSKLSDDIRVLTAVSWTYIVYCELINAHAGVGYMIYLAQRQSRVDKMFAILFVIILIGFLQDQFFKFLDKKFFRYKYL